MSDLDLDALEATARAATPGPWIMLGNCEYVAGISVYVAPDDGGVAGRDADYVAAFDPPTTLALITRIREAEATIDAVEDFVTRHYLDTTMGERVLGILTRHQDKRENGSER